MDIAEIKKDIQTLIKICDDIDNHWHEPGWVLSDEQLNDIYRITDREGEDWASDMDDFLEERLSYYISGMQRALQLIEERG